MTPSEIDGPGLSSPVPNSAEVNSPELKGPELDGKGALVTGSTGGIGFSIAEALAAAGCNVVLNGLEAPEEVADRVEGLARRHGVEAAYVQSDLSRMEGVEALVQQARSRLGSVDVLVNNAVVRHFAPIEDFSPADWEQALAVNVSAAFHAVRLLLPQMRAREWGRIVNMSSVYGNRGTPNRVDYVTTKAALLGFTRAVAMETVGQGITCNALCPGTVKTPAIEQRIDELVASGIARAEAEERILMGKQPTGRFVEAGHVADLVVFLCGPAGRDITGAMLPVEGGWLAS